MAVYTGGQKGSPQVECAVACAFQSFCFSEPMAYHTSSVLWGLGPALWLLDCMLLRSRILQRSCPRCQFLGGAGEDRAALTSVVSWCGLGLMLPLPRICPAPLCWAVGPCTMIDGMKVRSPVFTTGVVHVHTGMRLRL